MPMRSGVELACEVAVASAVRTTTILDSRRVVDVVADHCIMEDSVDRCSHRSCMLRRIVIENTGIIIIWVCTWIIRSSLLSRFS